MTILVAITGGIGSGKSTFSKEVTKRGLKLLDSDKEVSEIYKNPNKNFLQYLEKIGLGKSIEKNNINKTIISKVIFSNKSIRLKLEKYIFKIIRNNRNIFIKKEIKRKTKIVFFDIPLLFEKNLNRQFDTVISIVSNKKERYKRIKKSKKISEDLFKKIIKYQTTDVERKKKSDIVILNNKSLKEYKKKINKALDEILL